MDSHALMERFLQQRNVPPSQSGENFNKAGLVPFLRGEPYRFYVMKPVAAQAALGPPPFQLCKGTRMYRHVEKGWQDMRDGVIAGQEMEALSVTALREGIEELGVRLEALGGMLDLGPYTFASATSGKPRRMWLFAVEMQAENDVLPPDAVAQTTAERAWLSLAEFAAQGRNDHVSILRD